MNQFDVNTHVLESGHFETDGLCICGMQRAGWDS